MGGVGTLEFLVFLFDDHFDIRINFSALHT